MTTTLRRAERSHANTSVGDLRAFFGSAEMVESYDAARSFRPGERHMLTAYLHPRGTLLDVGCGTGRLSFLLADRYTHVDAFDVVPEVIDSANRRLAVEGGSLRFFVGDATRIAAADESYDNVIFGYNGIEGIPTPELRARALAEVRRVLRPGGRFVFSTKSCFTPDYLIELGLKPRLKALFGLAGSDEGVGPLRRGDIVHRERGRAVRLHTSSPFAVRRLLRRLGFEIVAFASEPRLARGDTRPSFFANFDPWDHFWACRKP